MSHYKCHLFITLLTYLLTYRVANKMKQQRKPDGVRIIRIRIHIQCLPGLGNTLCHTDLERFVVHLIPGNYTRHLTFISCKQVDHEQYSLSEFSVKGVLQLRFDFDSILIRLRFDYDESDQNCNSTIDSTAQ